MTSRLLSLDIVTLFPHSDATPPRASVYPDLVVVQDQLRESAQTLQPIGTSQLVT